MRFLINEIRSFSTRLSFFTSLHAFTKIVQQLRTVPSFYFLFNFPSFFYMGACQYIKIPYSLSFGNFGNFGFFWFIYWKPAVL